MKKIIKYGFTCLILNLTLTICLFSQKTTPPANPCEADEAKAFDFQIGAWQAKDGKEVHEIRKVLGGCGIEEVWKNDGVTESAIALKSLDAGRHNATGEQKWFYSWAAPGFHQLWEGRKENGQWRFYRNWFNQGQPIISRTYWNQLPDGSLDRIVEQSRDNGKTWTPWVKANFVKKPK